MSAQQPTPASVAALLRRRQAAKAASAKESTTQFKIASALLCITVAILYMLLFGGTTSSTALYNGDDDDDDTKSNTSTTTIRPGAADELACTPERAAKTRAMLGWAGKNVRLHRSVELASIAGGGCGLVAKRRIAADAELARVDESLHLCGRAVDAVVLDKARPDARVDWRAAFTSNNSNNSGNGDAAAAAEVTVSPKDHPRLLRAKLMLHLLLEKARGSDSAWQPYLASLPPLSEFDHFFHRFDARDRQLIASARPLQRTYLVRSAITRRDTINTIVLASPFRCSVVTRNTILTLPISHFLYTPSMITAGCERAGLAIDTCDFQSAIVRQRLVQSVASVVGVR
jgi:hypothetical protein